MFNTVIGKTYCFQCRSAALIGRLVWWTSLYSVLYCHLMINNRFLIEWSGRPLTICVNRLQLSIVCIRFALLFPRIYRNIYYFWIIFDSSHSLRWISFAHCLSVWMFHSFVCINHFPLSLHCLSLSPIQYNTTTQSLFVKLTL